MVCGLWFVVCGLWLFVLRPSLGIICIYLFLRSSSLRPHPLGIEASIGNKHSTSLFIEKINHGRAPIPTSCRDAAPDSTRGPMDGNVDNGC